MRLEEFIEKRPFVFHLTDQRNLPSIIETKSILSAKELVLLSDIQNKDEFLRQRRPGHVRLNIGDRFYYVRDQRPISEMALSKCLTDNWCCGDYIYHLNSRVFFWPTVERLVRHFKRYENERPVILKVSSEKLIDLNETIEFSRLNSGATRCNPYWGGAPPSRGRETFKPAAQFMRVVGAVAEVTIPDKASLPADFFISTSPQGPWNSLE